MRVFAYLSIAIMTFLPILANAETKTQDSVRKEVATMNESLEGNAGSTAATARPEHPFPQAQRSQWLNLNGFWEFAETNHDEADRFLSEKPFPEKIRVPFCRESSLSGIHRKELVKNVWYRRQFNLPQDWNSKRILLHIGACDWKTRVWINGSFVGRHTGGSCSFAFDVTSALQEGENALTIHAFDDTSSGLQALGKQAPDGVSRGCLYTPTTGIWQTVWLEGVGGSYVKRYHVDHEPEGKTISLEVEIDGPVKGLTLHATASAQGKKVGATRIPLKENRARFSLRLKDIHLWSPSDPYLYDLHLSLKKGRDKVDEVQGYFGLRTIRIEGSTIFINEEPVFQRLILDQGFYPDGIWTAPSDEALQKDIQLSKDCGFNGARLHQKVFEPRFHYWADRMGYLTWGEFPNWGLNYLDPEINQPVIEEWLEILERDRAHPSLIGWCPFNETPQSAAGLQQAIFFLTCSIDPSRPALETSGWTHTVPDPLLLDAHNYDQNPAKFQRFVRSSRDQAASRGGSNMEAEGSGKIPFFVSEYGGTGWDISSDSWGYGNTPKTIEEFYRRFQGLTDVLLDDSRMFGLCYTQLTNVEQEKNGLFLYDRSLKFDTPRLHAIMSRKAACENAGDLKIHRIEADARRGLYYAHRLKTFSDEMPDAPKGGGVFIGDSIIQGLPIREAFEGRPALNFGIAGDRIAGLANRLEVCVEDLEPKRVYLMIGMNDLLWSSSSIETLKKQYDRMLSDLQRVAGEAEITVLSILPVRGRFAENSALIRRFNATIENLARKRGLKYLDLHPRLADRKGELRADLTIDGLHLNLDGCLVWLSAVLNQEEFIEAAMNLSQVWLGERQLTFPVAKVDPSSEGDYPGSRGPDELVIYTPHYEKPRTNTNTFGKEAIVKNGVVQKISLSNSQIPSDGYVISGHGRADQWIVQNLKPGRPVKYDSHWVSFQTVLESEMTPKVRLKYLKDCLFDKLHKMKQSGADQTAKGKAGLLLKEILKWEASETVSSTPLDRIAQEIARLEIGTN